MIFTGDIAFRVLDELKEINKSNVDEDAFGHVTVCDINKSMLEVGQDRAQKVNTIRVDLIAVVPINFIWIVIAFQNHIFAIIFQVGYPSSHISWVQGDAQKLQFESNTFDAYTIAFGIRNVVDIDQVRYTYLNVRLIIRA